MLRYPTTAFTVAMHPLRPFLIILSVLALAAPAFAKTWHITVDGTGDAPSIQSAVLASSNGDTILVAPGHYTWSNQNTEPTDVYAMIQFDQGRERIALLSEAGPYQTIIDAEQQGRVMATKGLNYVTVDGFTLTGGRSHPLDLPIGGCMTLHISHDTFRNCIFTQNFSSSGAVAWVGGLAQPTFENCEFYENYGYNGTLFLVNTSTPITIRNCSFHHNVCDGGGGAIYMVHVRAVVEDCVFAFNRAPQGGAIYMTDMWEATVSRCTFVRNEGTETSGFHVLKSPGIRIENSIVSYAGEGTPYFFSANSAVTVACTNTFFNPVSNDLPANAIDGGGNFTANPLYCGSVDSMDYRLATTSPCLPGNHPDGTPCGQIGAFGACPSTPVHSRTLGGIKSLYR